MNGQAGSLHPLAPYPSPEERAQRFEALIERAGGEVLSYGASVEGRPLLAGRLPQWGADAQPHARVLATANIHGVEYVATQVVLGLVEAIDQLDSLRRLRARAEVWLIPSLNPDAYARVWDAGGQGELKDLRANAHGVDLNRNFPLPPGGLRKRRPGAGSPRPGAATYHGPAPLSEPESKALADFLTARSFHAATNGHSFMGRLIPPYVTTREDRRAYQTLCAAFGAAQPAQRYPRLAFPPVDTFTGELEDFQHHVLRTWAVCVETFPVARSFAQHLRAPSLFWRFNPREPRRWVDNDLPGIAAFLHAALDRGRPGAPAS
ncbi:MAG TPA: M14 family metallopeptidase [Polyangia bacterium]|jgi:hypothetical protein|nr:M14 family metallopeptidase [Polyangia bacterium]